MTFTKAQLRKGGKRGGKARAANMTAKQRSQSASKAAKARWAPKGDGVTDDTAAIQRILNKTKRVRASQPPETRRDGE